MADEISTVVTTPQADTGAETPPVAETPAASAAGADTTTQPTGDDTAPSTTAGEGGGETVQGQSADDKLVGAPAEYAAFSVPEGVDFTSETKTGLLTLGKELNLSQEALQKVINMGLAISGEQSAASATNLATVTAGWKAEFEADPELGGANLQATKATYATALNAFASDRLKEVLAGSGLGDHPEVVRLFVKIGKAISEDTLVVGGAGGDAQSRNGQVNPQRLYAGMNP